MVDPRYMYYVNDGVYGAMSSIIYDYAVVEPHLLNVCTRITDAYTLKISRTPSKNLCSL